MKSFLDKYPWVWFIFIAIFLFIAYKLYVYIFITLPQKKNYNAAVGQSQDALNQLAAKGVHPSYAQSQYTTMADALQQAFTGCGAAYDAVVKPTFQQMKNEADIYALIQNYGVRKFDECGWGTFEGDLGAAVGYKFSGLMFCSPTSLTCGSISDINKILKGNGLLFQF